MIEKALVQHLKAHPGVASIVGARVHAYELPQNPVYPAVTYLRVSTTETWSHHGSSGLERPRFQVTAWAETHAATRALAEEIKDAMRHFTGARLIGDQDLKDPDVKVFYAPIDVMFWVDI